MTAFNGVFVGSGKIPRATRICVRKISARVDHASLLERGVHGKYPSRSLSGCSRASSGSWPCGNARGASAANAGMARQTRRIGWSRFMRKEVSIHVQLPSFNNQRSFREACASSGSVGGVGRRDAGKGACGRGSVDTGDAADRAGEGSVGLDDSADRVDDGSMGADAEQERVDDVSVGVEREEVSVEREAVSLEREAVGVEREAVGVEREGVGADRSWRRISRALISRFSLSWAPCPFPHRAMLSNQHHIVVGEGEGETLHVSETFVAPRRGGGL